MRAYTFDALYNKLGYVTQKAVLFSGTVEDNVFFGQSAAEKTDASLQAALSLSQAAEFVDKYPEKAAHPIAQLGRNVSGGQKQAFHRTGAGKKAGNSDFRRFVLRAGL